MNFCARLKSAILLRERTKAAIRLQHFVDSAPADSFAPVSDSWLKSIHARGTTFVQRYAAAAAAAAASAGAGKKGRGAAAAAAAAAASPLDPADYTMTSPAMAHLFAEVVEEYDMAMKVRRCPAPVTSPRDVAAVSKRGVLVTVPSHPSLRPSPHSS
jgi:hypothetical protein